METVNAVIYARYSSDNQREESIDGQIRECTEFAERKGYTVVDTYIDRAYFAKTDKRPSFLNMIKASSSKSFEVIIVWKLDRFARNRYDSAKYKHILKKNGVSVISATEVISETPEGILLETMLEGYAEYYSVELGEKVDRGMKENVLNGKCNGGTPTLGYKVDENKKFILDPFVAPAVLEAFQNYAAGHSMKDIADDFNSKGIRSPRCGLITINAVTRMLHNRRYLGEYRYKDTVVRDGFPRIVSDELFEQVQEKLAVNKKTSAKHKAKEEYLLTPKLFCGKCGQLMTGEYGTSGTAGNIYRYYKCRGVKYHMGCDKKTVRKEMIEDIVIEQVRSVLSNDVLLNRIADDIMGMLKAENTLLPVLYREKKEVEKGIENMLDAIQRGIITESTKDGLEALEKQKKELVIQIAKEEAARPTITKEHILFWFKKLKKLEIRKIEHRRRPINIFVNSVYLYDDKLVITFNYKDGTKTVNFEKIKNSTSSSVMKNKGAPEKEQFMRCMSCSFSYSKSVFLPVIPCFGRCVAAVNWRGYSRCLWQIQGVPAQEEIGSIAKRFKRARRPYS